MAKVMTHDKTNGNGKMNGKLNGKAASAPFKTRNDMDSDTRKHVIALLNEHLACTFDLMSQTKQAHWNVKGKHFIGLHLLFDEFCRRLGRLRGQIGRARDGSGWHRHGHGPHGC